MAPPVAEVERHAEGRQRQPPELRGCRPRLLPGAPAAGVEREADEVGIGACPPPDAHRAGKRSLLEEELPGRRRRLDVELESTVADSAFEVLLVDEDLVDMALDVPERHPVPDDRLDDLPPALLERKRELAQDVGAQHAD